MNKYHCIVFDELDEGAAFLAALSRYLLSPSGPPAGGSTAAEIFAARQRDSPELKVYLNEAALEATVAGFGQPAVVDTCAVEALPIGRIAIFTGSRRTPFGKDDVVRRMTLVEG